MHRVFSVTALGVFFMLLGCAPVVVHPSPLAKLSSAPDAPAPYRIGAGDELEVKFFFTPELNETMQVRPDGKISLMFAQDIDVAGKTPEELAATIKKKLRPHLKQSDLVVIMHNFASQKVYVAGEVGRPGPVILSGRETLMQALDDAGWMTPNAQRDEVVLVRRGSEGREAVYLLDVSKIIDGEDTAQDITVQAGDLLLVPPSDAVSFDRWIDRNIRQALPFSTSAGVIYTNENLGSVR